MHTYIGKPRAKENKKSVAANAVAQKKGHGKQSVGLMDNRTVAVTQKNIQRQAVDHPKESPIDDNKNVVQRIVRQSDFLKFKRVKDEEGEVGIYRSAGASGPWAKINDKTNAAYRDAAVEILGSRDALYYLGFHDVIVEKNNGGRNPYTNSHLIGAAFGGQLKYPSPADNIRYHPEAVEYGKWQEDESKVEKKGRLGYITAASYDSSSGVAANMASAIIGVIRGDHSSHEADQLEQELKQMLTCVEYIPPTVVFRYDDIEDPGLSFREQWDKVNAGLQLSSGVTKVGVYRALFDMKVIKDENKVPVDIKPATLVISSRSDIVNLLKRITVSNNGRMKTILKGLNTKFTLMASIRNKVFVDYLLNQQEVKALKLSIDIAEGFDLSTVSTVTPDDLSLSPGATSSGTTSSGAVSSNLGDE
ncbi:hypothetical protein AAE036_001079 [Salmonella enterica]|nr:hypothetical protein [Salmonella enterica]ECC1574133.1 hypothetical protein [Salmonella enterica subsp. diarizonae]ECI2915875.1 hypothetical protein [Salmonella enterica subsp. diarizonae]ECO7559864.1 hypothetical protein [Salmonella enterica]EDJ9763788.1 hypothetical protein [Salmonella enterica]